MKKTTIILATLLTSTFLSAQATLEHTYSSSVQDYDMSSVIAFNDSNGIKYFTYNRATSTVTVYDENHTSVSSFIIPIDQDSYLSEFLFITDHLFNSDDQLEFLYKTYKNDPDFSLERKIYLCNDSGTLLQSFPDRYYARLIKNNSNNYKLILAGEETNPSTMLYDFDVYSLSGALSTTQQEYMLGKALIGYPNPTGNTFTISNKIRNGENATLEIYSVNGSKVLEKQFYGDATPITIDVSALSKGVYIYKINGETNRFIKK